MVLILITAGDPQAMRQEVARFCPADVAGYERFMEKAEACYRLGFEELGSIAFESLWDLIAAIPNMVRMRALAINLCHGL
jgi:phytoene desaturase